MSFVTSSAPRLATSTADGPHAPRCLLDSVESQALLDRHGIHLKQEQVAIFRDIETRWDVDVFNPDTAGCLVNGRFTQTAVDGYFMVIEEIWQGGPTATIDRIVQTLADLFPEGVAFVLYAAAKCMVFSDAIAHEAYRQLMMSRIDRRRRTPRVAIKEYTARLTMGNALLGRAENYRPARRPLDLEMTSTEN